MELVTQGDGWRPTPPPKTGRISKTATLLTSLFGRRRLRNTPNGWDYGLHLGEVGGNTTLRYDNAHERTKGPERHTQDGVEIIEFPGMLTLYDRFKREAEEMSPVSWNWPE